MNTTRGLGTHSHRANTASDAALPEGRTNATLGGQPAPHGPPRPPGTHSRPLGAATVARRGRRARRRPPDQEIRINKARRRPAAPRHNKGRRSGPAPPPPSSLQGPAGRRPPRAGNAATKTKGKGPGAGSGGRGHLRPGIPRERAATTACGRAEGAGRRRGARVGAGGGATKRRGPGSGGHSPGGGRQGAPGGPALPAGAGGGSGGRPLLSSPLRSCSHSRSGTGGRGPGPEGGSPAEARAGSGGRHRCSALRPGSSRPHQGRAGRGGAGRRERGRSPWRPVAILVLLLLRGTECPLPARLPALPPPSRPPLLLLLAGCGRCRSRARVWFGPAGPAEGLGNGGRRERRLTGLPTAPPRRCPRSLWAAAVFQCICGLLARFLAASGARGVRRRVTCLLLLLADARRPLCPSPQRYPRRPAA